MKRIIPVLLAALALIAGCGPNSPQVVKDVKIDLRAEPDPPAAGETTLYITVTEADGTPIDDAAISVHGNMDHEGMEPVDRKSDAPGDKGEYTVPFEWTMGGGWIIDVTATLPDNRGIAQAQFTVFVEAVSPDSIINQTGHANMAMSGDDSDSDMDMSGDSQADMSNDS